MKKRFFILLACGTALGLLISSGLSCISCIIYPEGPITYWLPATDSEFKSWIMPECQEIKETLQDILGDPPYTLSQVGFDHIRDWVADNIEYESDEEQWGKDYWQTPEETLSYSTGDCEDFSALLCSLLRAYGIDAEQVYIALGIDDEEYGHAFLIEDWNYDGVWRRIESQAPASWPGQFGSHEPHPDSRLDEYEITAAFNDFYYYDEPFPWDAD